MANQWFLIDCNIFWNIFGTTGNVTKYGPSEPVFITKILQQIQDFLWGHPWKVSSYLRTLIYEAFGRSVYIAFRVFYFWKFETLKLRTLKSYKLKNGIGKYEDLKMKSENGILELGNRTWQTCNFIFLKYWFCWF